MPRKPVLLELRCRWTSQCQQPARFSVGSTAPYDGWVAEEPGVCARHLAEAVRTRAVVDGVRDIVVRVS